MSPKPNKLEAADKVTLLLSFVPYLIRQRRASVQELSQRFEITQTQVKELIYLLSVSGIPGESGVYQHQDLFDIDWDLFEKEDIVELWHHVALDSTPKLSAREAAALVAGLQYISGVILENERSVIDQLLTKISQGASSLPENILLAPAETYGFNDFLTNSIRSHNVVVFNYRNNLGIISTRRVNPLRIDVISGVTYLRGWCHDRKDIRTFRFDRMSDLVMTDTTFDPSEFGPIEDDLYKSSDDDHIVQCVVSNDVLPLISAYSPLLIGPEENDSSRVEIAFGSEKALIAFVSLFPGLISVVSPERAVNVVKDWVKSTIASMNA